MFLSFSISSAFLESKSKFRMETPDLIFFLSSEESEESEGSVLFRFFVPSPSVIVSSAISTTGSGDLGAGSKDLGDLEPFGGLVNHGDLFRFFAETIRGSSSSLLDAYLIRRKCLVLDLFREKLLSL